MNENARPPALVEIRLDMPIEADEYDHETGAPMAPGRTLRDLIVDRAAAQLVASLGDGVKREITMAVTATVQDQITAKVSAWVEAALARPLQKTTHYGEPTGEALPLSEFVTQRAKDWLTASVNSRGEPANTYDRGGKTRIAHLIDTEVDRAMSKELTDSIRAARAQVVGAVQVRAGELLGEAIRTANLLDGAR